MSTPEWLTVSQAAARAGVSEKTLRKRIAKGEVTAERETLPTGGWAWRVDANRLETSNRFQPREGSAKERLEGVAEAAGVERPTVANRVAELPSVHVPSVPGGADVTRECELLREALQRERENADQWRAQVEAANRDAAESRAIMREMSKAMPKAIEAGKLGEVAPEAFGQVRTGNADQLGQVGTGKQSAPGAPQARENSETGKAARPAANAREGGKTGAPRNIWRVILGLR